MQSLQDLVLDTVNDFMQNNALFTALDVSNKVKETMPAARHKEVRNVVRSLFVAYIEPNSYSRTPINVDLSDGSTTEALLYHPLSSSYNLDVEYDAQKRAQASARHQAPTGSSVVVDDNGITLTGPTVTIQNQPPASSTSVKDVARNIWSELFNSRPSLFPRG